MKKILMQLMLLFITAACSTAQNILPQPQSIVAKAGRQQFKTVYIQAAPGFEQEKTYLENILKQDMAIGISNQQNKDAITVKLLAGNIPFLKKSAEAYLLTVNNKGVSITSASAAGVFYAIQSLRQLIEKANNAYSIANVEIKDSPRFKWRSFMLDEARYFKGEAVVKTLLNEMALLKMNVFHWHLTDDQGWRIHIDKYPELTAVGGYRDSTETGNWNSGKYDGKPHEGYYTKAQIQDIVSYAEKLHITVVPEIEMPGHASAAIAAYPWLGANNAPIKVPGNFGVKYDVFDVSNAAVVAFLKDVLVETMDLFPSKVVHIGGDEVKYDQWQSSPKVKEYMAQHQLTSMADLQVFFTNSISHFLESKGKRMMGWNEIMGTNIHDYTTAHANAKGALAKTAIIHFWRGDTSLIKDALQKGHDIVNSYHERTYLDYSYEMLPLEKAYSFNPVPDGTPQKLQAQIIGVGAQMWGEWTPTAPSMYQKAFPRLAAIADVGWTAAPKDFNRFKAALTPFYTRWKALNILE